MVLQRTRCSSMLCLLFGGRKHSHEDFSSCAPEPRNEVAMDARADRHIRTYI